MITITPQAAEQIRISAQQSAQESTANEVYLRLVARMDDKGALEYGMGLDDRAENDLLAVSEGIKVLISPGSVELLTGATLDYVAVSPGEHRFIFINPNDPSHKSPGHP